MLTGSSLSALIVAELNARQRHSRHEAFDATMRDLAKAMTIAGSDSGGGAGIQADLKTFAAMGVYGTSVLTAITAQNTQTVTEVVDMPDTMIRSQIDAVISDIGADAVKTGMLSSADIIETVAEKVTEHGMVPLVVDPVMVAKGGARLLREDAVDALKSALIPLATVVTPNIPEAEVLVGHKIEDMDGMRDAAKEIVALGARSVVVKGGHMEGPATDIMFDGSDIKAFTSQRISTDNTHGTGCTFASAIAAGLAKGNSVRDSVSDAKKYVTEAIRFAPNIGNGNGPLNHFYMLRG